jgi:hypothetical protein
VVEVGRTAAREPLIWKEDPGIDFSKKDLDILKTAVYFGAQEGWADRT